MMVQLRMRATSCTSIAASWRRLALRPYLAGSPNCARRASQPGRHWLTRRRLTLVSGVSQPSRVRVCGHGLPSHQQRGQAGPKRASLALARWARMGRWAACLPPAGAGALNRHGRASEQHERAEADHRHGRWEANLSGEGGALPRSGNSPRAPIIFPGVFFFEFVSWGMQPLQAKTLEVTCFQHFFLTQHTGGHTRVGKA